VTRAPTSFRQRYRLLGGRCTVSWSLFPIALLSLMTYVIMPQLSRLIGGWLYPH